jgi:hypothetical protein
MQRPKLVSVRKRRIGFRAGDMPREPMDDEREMYLLRSHGRGVAVIGTTGLAVEHGNGRRLLMTAPPYLTRIANELLLPREVVERDMSR